MRPTHLELFHIAGQLEPYLSEESMKVINGIAYNTTEEYIDEAGERKVQYVNFLQVYRDVTIVRNITSRSNKGFEYMKMLNSNDFKMFAEIINKNVEEGYCKNKSLGEPMLFVSQFQPNHSSIRFVFGFYALGDTIFMNHDNVDFKSEMKQNEYRKHGFVFEGGENMLSLGEVHRNLFGSNPIQNPLL